MILVAGDPLEISEIFGKKNKIEDTYSDPNTHIG